MEKANTVPRKYDVFMKVYYSEGFRRHIPNYSKKWKRKRSGLILDVNMQLKKEVKHRTEKVDLLNKLGKNTK